MSTFDFVFFLIGFLIIAYLWLTRSKAVGPDTSWLPRELHQAKLIGVEKEVALRGRYRINGKIDRLYQLPDGQLVPVERKSHKKRTVYPTDKLQLSLYGYILRQQGERVAPFGFVVLSDLRTALKTTLLDEPETEQKLERYALLKAGEIEPLRALNYKCNNCGHRQKCAN